MKKKKNPVTRNPQVDGVAVTASQRCFNGYGALIMVRLIRLVQITWDVSRRTNTLATIKINIKNHSYHTIIIFRIP